jgi:hypothetical protein
MKDSQKELYKAVFRIVAGIGFFLLIMAANDQTFANLGL